MSLDKKVRDNRYDTLQWRVGQLEARYQVYLREHKLTDTGYNRFAYVLQHEHIMPSLPPPTYPPANKKEMGLLLFSERPKQTKMPKE